MMERPGEGARLLVEILTGRLGTAPGRAPARRAVRPGRASATVTAVQTVTKARGCQFNKEQTREWTPVTPHCRRDPARDSAARENSATGSASERRPAYG